MDIPMDRTAPELPGRGSRGAASSSVPDHRHGDPALRAGIERYPLDFSGSGGDYFRIWIVNVLLTVVTLGLYAPFARRRTARYFYGETVVADSPLEFTARKGKMFVGFVLMVVLVLVYQVAANTGQVFVAGLLLFGAALAAPWLWGSAMRFRLASTRWRGIRLQFRASWLEVYQAGWPVFALALAWTIVAGAVTQLAGDGKGFADPDRSLLVFAALLAVAAVVATVLCLIQLEFNYKRLLVARALIGNQVGHWKPVYRDFVRIWASAFALFVACTAVTLGLAALAWWTYFPGLLGTAGFGLILIVPLLVLGALAAIWLVAVLPAWAYREARIFQLVWNNVGVSHLARFRCDLSARAYVLLRMRNMLLTMLTLGLYRPFAMVSEYRMKCESVTVLVKGGLDQLVGQMAPQPGALGDAVADAVGLDLIG